MTFWIRSPSNSKLAKKKPSSGICIGLILDLIKNQVIMHSELFYYRNMKLQAHLCVTIKTKGSLNSSLNTVESVQHIITYLEGRTGHAYVKAQPVAYRVWSSGQEICEEYKDKGYSGAGLHLLKLLKKHEMFGAFLAVSVSYTSLPFNYTIDYYPILSCASVTSSLTFCIGIYAGSAEHGTAQQTTARFWNFHNQIQTKSVGESFVQSERAHLQSKKGIAEGEATEPVFHAKGWHRGK